PTLKSGRNPDHFDLAGRLIHRDFGARCDVATLLYSAGDSNSSARCRLPAPAESFCRSNEDGLQTLIFQIAKPELKRIDSEHCGQLVHVRLASEVIRRCRQTAIRTLSQR